MISVLLASAAFLLPAVPQGDPNYEVVRVLDGRLLIGEIIDHDLDGLMVESARNGGRFQLAWSDLFPGEAERLKTGFGYKTEFQTPMVTADHLLLVNGQQITGRILRRDNREIEIRSRAMTTVVPISRLAAPPEKVVVDATEVLTAEQFYNERLSQINETDAMAQYEFARELEAVSAYQQALAHLTIAAELGAGDSALLSRIEGSIPRIETAIKHRLETDKIKEIRTLMYRERFSLAEEKLQAFKDEHPNSPVYEDYLKVAEKFESEREKAMIRYLSLNWYKRAASMLKKKSLDRKATMESLQTYATTDVPQALRVAMAEELDVMKEGMDLSEVDGLWQRRKERKTKRHQAGFGNGTWILGEARARAGMKAEEEAEENDGRTQAEKDLQDRYRRYLENLESSRRAAGTNEEDSPDDWWKNATASARYMWLLAYYAEFSGDFELLKVYFDGCPTCNGDGFIELIELGASSTSGGKKRKKCTTCHGVAVKRSLFFR